MTRPMRPRADVRLRGDNRLALLLLTAGAFALLAAQMAAPAVDLGRGLPLDAARADAATERIDPNTAPLESLVRLPGIGPGRARAILDDRSRPGAAAYRSCDDLRRIRGIDVAVARDLAPHLTFGPAGGSDPR